MLQKPNQFIDRRCDGVFGKPGNGSPDAFQSFGLKLITMTEIPKPGGLKLPTLEYCECVFFFPTTGIDHTNLPSRKKRQPFFKQSKGFKELGDQPYH